MATQQLKATQPNQRALDELADRVEWFFVTRELAKRAKPQSKKRRSAKTTSVTIKA